MKSKYIRMIRPVAWIVFLFPFSVGFGIGATKNTNPIHVIFSLIAFASCMSFSFMINSLDEFSMSPLSILQIKKLINSMMEDQRI